MNERLRLTPGMVFANDYKVVRPLRVGGQGSLYVVEQISTSKHRALKLMLPELVANEVSRKRFELEAKIAARIQSDHVVESIASGVDVKSGTPWLVMELLEGQDLASYTQQKKRLPPHDVLEIFDQLCHALGEAHRQGIVHRDLKPENIFLAAARRRGVPFMVKVLDFGIARIVAEVQTVSGGTTTGLGTPMWMAPEQTVPGGPVSPATDVWPLGLLAFRLLTGYLFWKTPYDPGASVMMLMAEAFMHPMPSASERAAQYKCADRIPPGFDAWFARCVSRPMEPRYQNAAEVFAALEPVLGAVAEKPPPSRLSSAGSIPDRSSLPGVVSITGHVASTTGPGTKTGAPEVVTGPGMPTWGGAPVLAESAVVSDLSLPPEVPALTGPQLTPNPGSAEPVASAETELEKRGSLPSAPVSAPPAPPSPPTPPQVTADHAPPVQKAAPPPPPPGRSRARTVILSAIGAGVLMGVGLFALQRGGAPGGQGQGTQPITTAIESRPARPSASATASASASATADPSASSEVVLNADMVTPAGSAGLGGHGKAPKRCKAAGQKCFGNDDCCDRTCRKWVCQANPALANPYPE